METVLPLMIVNDPRKTAQQAASQFAEEFWAEPREIDWSTWKDSTFALVNGTRRYVVKPAPYGWKIYQGEPL